MIIVPAANTAVEQSAQNENIEQIRQSRDIGPSNQQLNVTSNRSSTCLADNEKSPTMSEGQAETEDEKFLMATKRVYQQTTQPVDENVRHRSSKWGSKVNCRTALYYVAFVGFMVNYMYRININITIVEMVSIKKSSVTNNATSECLAHQLTEPSANMTTPSNIYVNVQVH